MIVNVYKDASVFFFFPSPSQLPLETMTSTDIWSQFDQFLNANQDTTNAFYLRSPVALPYQPNSRLSSSFHPQTTQVDTFNFNFDEFVSNFTLPPATSTPHYERADLVREPGEASTLTSLCSKPLYPPQFVLNADSLTTENSLLAQRSHDYASPVADRPAASTAPDTTASKKRGNKRSQVIGESSNSGRQRGVRGPYSNADQRKKSLEEDEYVAEINEKKSQVLCAGCDNQINLDKRGRLYLQNWYTHRKRCKGVKDGIVSHLNTRF